jgi:hypothetical protein
MKNLENRINLLEDKKNNGTITMENEVLLIKLVAMFEKALLG